MNWFGGDFGVDFEWFSDALGTIFHSFVDPKAGLKLPKRDGSSERILIPHSVDCEWHQRRSATSKEQLQNRMVLKTELAF